MPDPDRFNSSHNKLCFIISHLCMKLAGGASHFSSPQYQLQYSIRHLVCQVFTHVEASFTDKLINLTDVLTLITILETVFVDTDYVATVEKKLRHLNKPIATSLPIMQNFNIILLMSNEVTLQNTLHSYEA
jgi:hypothetical protein